MNKYKHVCVYTCTCKYFNTCIYLHVQVLEEQLQRNAHTRIIIDTHALPFSKEPWDELKSAVFDVLQEHWWITGTATEDGVEFVLRE